MPTLHDVIQDTEGINPFTDPEFNNCLVNDVASDDLAEMVGLSIEGAAGATGAAGERGEGDCLWKKVGLHIFNKNHKDGTVAIGTNAPNEDYKAHVEGDFLTRSPASGTAVWADVVGRN